MAYDDVVISNLALERARALSPALARMDDRKARMALAALACAGDREESVDHRTGEPQTLVALADFGFAVLKGLIVVTCVDADGRRYLLARGKRPASPPRLRRVDAEGDDELARFAVDGCPTVTGLTVARDGSVNLIAGDAR